jgi:hypothetical protein
MGTILETNDEVLGLEERRESVGIMDLQRKYPSDFPPPVKRFGVVKNLKGTRYQYQIIYQGLHWLDCGDNEYVAEQTCVALNKLEQEKDAAESKRRNLSEHIFAYADGEIEISKEFLRKLVDYLNANPTVLEK